MKSIEELYLEFENINNEIDKIMNDYYNNHNNIDISKLEELRTQKWKINDEIQLYYYILVCSNNEVDIYKQDENVDGEYKVTLHNTREVIGKINFDSKKSQNVFGNTLLEIDEKYNIDYYELLKVFIDYLKNKDINLLSISVSIDNKILNECMKLFDNYEVEDIRGFNIYKIRV